LLVIYAGRQRKCTDQRAFAPSLGSWLMTGTGLSTLLHQKNKNYNHCFRAKNAKQHDALFHSEYSSTDVGISQP
jgi:hypothetical protein